MALPSRRWTTRERMTPDDAIDLLADVNPIFETTLRWLLKTPGAPPFSVG